MNAPPFETILKDFEPFFQCSLQPDHNDSCLIKMGIGLHVQMELYNNGFLLIGCRLGILPAGNYRNQIIRAALQSNTHQLPSAGVFGLSPKSHQLILFLFLDPRHLTADKILAIMTPFLARAKEWADALSQGTVPSVTKSDDLSQSPIKLFGGLKP